MSVTDAYADAYAYAEGNLMTEFLTEAIGLRSHPKGGGDLIKLGGGDLFGMGETYLGWGRPAIFKCFQC